MVLGMRGSPAGSERAPGAAGRLGGVLAWNEMEEGASGPPFPSLPSSSPGAQARGACGSSLDRWARDPVGACCRRVGWAGVMPRHARGSFDLAEGSREGRAHVPPALPRVAGVAAGKTRKVWAGEENSVSRGKALGVGCRVVVVRRGITLSSPLHA